MKHYSVLLNETIQKLNIKENGTYVDCTLGLGGHTKIIAQIAKKGKVISFDQDLESINKAKKNLSNFKNIFFINENFSEIEKNLNKLGINKVDGIIYDLGTSTYQLTNKERGFTYHGKSLIDMRMNKKQKLSAIEVLNNYSEEKLSKIFYKYGDEKKHKQIAKEILNYRKNKKIEYNTQLNEIIKKVKGYSKSKHPSKNIFQAIRIEVNNEIESIKKSISSSIKILKKDCSIAVITFHSLEDKVVKEIFWNLKQKIKVTPFENIHYFKTSKTIYPSKKEIEENKSSRSAKLRVITKLKD